MSLTIPVAHDFICPWCWVGIIQAIRLRAEFSVEFDWLGYELFPEELEWPEWKAGDPPPANKPPTPSRFDFILIADSMKVPPSDRPKKMRTFYAHEAVEYAKTESVANELVERLYRAYWEDGKEINNPEVLVQLGKGLIQDLSAYESSIRERKNRDQIVGFDEPAYAGGIYNVPTFFIGGERYAEQPYVVLRDALKKVLG